jgi:hypothetical protein
MQPFARNAIEPAQLTAFADAICAEPEPKWLLVDHAIVDPGKSACASASLGWKSRPAFEGSALGTFGMSGPHLHGLPKLTPEALSRALSPWTAIEPTGAGLSVVCSRAGEQALQATLAYLALATVDGELRLHCRCADARVLTNLLPVLSAAQAARVARSVQSWWWLGASGSVSHWPVARPQAPGGAEADPLDHLHLNAKQFARMMDDGEPDIMFAMLLDKTSELVPDTGRGDFRTQLQRILATASRFAVTQAPDRLQFAVLSLASGEDFHAHPGLEPTWRNIRERGANLKQEMTTWSDALWTEIDNGRQPAQ